MTDWGWAKDVSLGGLGAGLLAAGQYYLALRQDRRAEGQTVTQRVDKLFDQLQKQLDASNEQLGKFAVEIEQLRMARFSLEDRCMALRDHALAARTMVHELQRRLGEPETVFGPLPWPLIATPRAPPAVPPPP